jgi:MFS family permease
MSTQEGSWLSLLKMSGPQRLLETGALLNTTAFFAAMPFAPLYLSSHTAMSKATIGAVVGALYLIGAFGLVGGFLVDRLGATKIMWIGLWLDVLIYAGLIVARQPVLIVALFIALGPARLMVEPGSKKLLSLAAAGDARVFRRRYMTWCAGAIIGPAISSVLYPISPVAFFAVPAVLYTGFLVTVTVRRRTLLALETRREDAAPEPAGSWRVVIRDSRLHYVIAGGLILFLVFSQLETMIPLYMKAHFGSRTGQYFAVLFITNAVLAVAFQIPIDKLSGKLSRRRILSIGCVSFALAFVFFWAGARDLLLLYVGVMFWTIGEGTLVPVPDMLVHEIAADGHKGMYFGLSDMRQLGFFVGPVAGGLLLADSTAAYFAVMAGVVFVCLPLLLRAATQTAQSASSARSARSASSARSAEAAAGATEVAPEPARTALEPAQTAPEPAKTQPAPVAGR